MSSKYGVSSPPHAVLFPFMAKGHTIPVLHLARLLLRRGISVTIITTPANRTFIANSLSDTPTSIIDIPFPNNIPGIPAGVEGLDKLLNKSLFGAFSIGTRLMQPHFEKVLENLLPPVSFLVSDTITPWTLRAASKFGIPRLVMQCNSSYSMAILKNAGKNGLLSPSDDDQPFTVPSFPWIRLTKNDVRALVAEVAEDITGPRAELCRDIMTTTPNSYGAIVNSFYELEPGFVDYLNRECAPKAFCVGPLCLAEPAKEPHKKPTWVQWLDQKSNENKSVLYVAFGSEAKISPEQFKEIALGLEASKTNFLWVVKEIKGFELEEDGFEERVNERGIVVREWVDQREILEHESVQGFVSHCGWNSCLESICACVPILAFPLSADQHLNARMVVEEIKIGIRVETCDGSVTGFVKREGLEKMVRELMKGEKGKEVRKKVKEVGETARKAMEEGGSSCKTLDHLIDELCNKT